MKKLALLSDLHLDVNQFTDTEIQVLIDTLQAICDRLALCRRHVQRL